MNGYAVKRVACKKFWVVIIDENLSWKYHLRFSCSKLSKMCGILLKIRDNLTKEALRKHIPFPVLPSYYILFVHLGLYLAIICKGCICNSEKADQTYYI